MKADAVLVRGEKPWRPCADVENLRIRESGDYPSLGRSETKGRTVLYSVVGGLGRDLDGGGDSCASVRACACIEPAARAPSRAS